MPIQLLDRDVASKIAAGEVIERPASVVKELVENAIDAGAGQIEVEIARGGLDLIRVTDDAAGIPEDELELAVTRHATSKLRSVQDLSRIGTLGFRGEALASIGAVARMTLVSRVPDTEGGNYVIVDNNEIIERGRQGAPFGTTAFVRDLFKSVPARLSFLRSPAAEATRCVTVLTQYALAHPDVALRVLVDGRLAFHSPGSGDASHVLLEMWGPDTASAMLPIQPTTMGGTTVSGYASEPATTRPRRAGQILFVNGRLVEARILSYAIADAYRDIIQRGRYPLVVLFVTVPPDEVDVNVHPTKAEVRLRREGEVIAAVQRAIRRALAAHGIVVAPSTGGQGNAPPIPTAPPDSEVQLEAPPLFPDPSRPTPPHSQDPRHSRESGNLDPHSATQQGDANPPPPQFTLRPVGQVGLTYIVAEGPDGMYLIDQHAAHERIVFEQVLSERGNRAATSQGLLTPATVQLTTRQQEVIAPLNDLLTSYGFEWEPFGDDAILLRAMPATLKESEAAQALLEVLDERSGGDIDASDSIPSDSITPPDHSRPPSDNPAPPSDNPAPPSDNPAPPSDNPAPQSDMPTPPIRLSRDPLRHSRDPLRHSRESGNLNLEEQSNTDPVDMRERRIAATIACHSTVRAGQTLSLSEMESLITSFRDANFPRLCPHGRPTMVHLSAAQLERQFGRR